jgi:hypothetical protein
MVDAEHVLTDVTEVADILTTVSNNTRASLGDINAGMRSLAPAAARAGLSYNEAAAAIGFFVDNGLTGADAGVSLTRAMTELADPTSAATIAMDQLGITAYDVQGNFVGFPALFTQLQTAMVGLTQQEQEMILSTIFGAEAIDVMGIAALTGGDDLQALTDATNEAGTAAEQSAIRMDTLGAQFATLKEGLNSFLGSLVAGLIPGLRVFVDAGNALIDVLMKIPAPIKTIIGAVAGLLAGFASISIAIKGFAALSGFLGIGGGLGIGAALGAVVPILLGVAAAAAVVYVAWRKNFLGIRTVVGNALKGVTGFIDRFKDAWNGLTETSDVMNQIFAWGGQAANIVEPLNSVSRTLIALGAAIRGIGGGDIPFFNNLADSLDRAAGFVDRFKTAWDSLGPSDVMSQINQWGGVATEQMGMVERAMTAFDIASGGMLTRLREMTTADWAVAIGDIAVTVGGWVFNVAVDLASALGSWLLGQAVNLVHSIPSIAVSIGGWIVSAATTLWDAVKSWIMGGSGAGSTGDPTGASGGGSAAQTITLGMVSAKISGWIVSAATSLWDTIKNWITGAGGTGSTGDPTGASGGGGAAAAVTLSDVAVSIGSWVMEAGANLYDVVQPWVEAAVSAVGGIVQQIPSVLVSIGSWVMQAGANLYDAVGPWIDAAVGAISGLAHQIPSITVNIGAWIQGTIPPLWETVMGWFAGAGGGGGVGVPTGAAGGAGAAGQGITIPSILVNIGAWAQGEIGDITASIVSWVEGQVAGIDFTGIGLTLKSKFFSAMGSAFSIGEGIGGLLGGAIDLGVQILDWVTQQIEGVHWPSVGSSFALLLIDAIKGAVVGTVALPGLTGSLIGGILNALADVPWSSVATSIKDFLTAAISGLEGFATGFALTLTSEFGQAVAGVNWSGIAGSIRDQLTAAISGLVGFAGNLATTLGAEFEQAIAGVNWGGLASAINGYLLGKAADMAKGLWDAIVAVIMGDAASNPLNPDNIDLGEKPGGNAGGIANLIADLQRGRAELGLFREEARGVGDALKTVFSGGIDMSGLAAAKAELAGMGEAARGVADGMKAAFSGSIDMSGIVSGLQAAKAEMAGMGEAARGVGEGLKAAFAGIDTSGFLTGLDSAKARLAEAITITVDNSAALAAVQAVNDAIASLGGGGLKGGGASVSITADTSAAVMAIGVVRGLMSGINGLASTVILLGNSSAAVIAITTVRGLMSAINGMTSTIFIRGDNSSAMQAIREVQAYAGRSLGTATFTVRTVSVGSPTAVGAGMGAGVMKGWDQATGTNSPSTEMIKRGQYLYQGLNIGWTGSAQNLPIGFDVARPSAAQSSGGGSGSTVTTIDARFVNNAPIYGVEDLDDRLAQHTNQLADALQRNRVAAGVT